ncbi:hypothetical protein Aduo_006586 [Ancylostoma duodenale]
MDTEVQQMDGWNYALFSLEMTTNLLFIPVDFVLFYICIAQKNLHINFRSALFITAAGYFICDIHRLILVPTRMCCIGLQNTVLVGQLFHMQNTGLNIILFGMVFVVIERAIASASTSTYEAQCKGYLVPSILCGTVVILAALITVITGFQWIPDFDWYVMGVQILAVILCLVALIVIVSFNTSAYRRRHSVTVPLSDKYQMDENIRVGRYLIPVALNDVVCQVIFISLIAYSLLFTDIPLGQDTSHLSHGYDLLLSYQRMFFGLALVLRSEKLDNLLNRSKRSTKVMGRQAAAASNHFNELREMWS